MNFSQTKKATKANLEAIKLILDECVYEGMLDPNAHFYNELLDFLSEVQLAESFAEIEEVIAQAKLLEMDIDAWLSRKGRTTLSLKWPILK